MAPQATSGEPALSIVVASFCGDESLRRCLGSLEAQRGDAEVIVVGALEPAGANRLAASFPWMTVYLAPQGSSVFRLRSLGVARSRGSVIVLLEDHCSVTRGWLEAFVAARADAQRHLGGPVAAGPVGSIRAFSLFLMEYGALMPPLAETHGDAVLAVNAAYAREPLLACRDVWEHAFYDNEVRDSLREAGCAPQVVTNAVVHSHLDMALKEAAAHLYAGGRRYGAYRRLRAGPFKSLLLPLAAPVVPFILLGRILVRLARRRARWLFMLPAATPYLLWLAGAWSAGEAVGCLASPAPERG